MSERLTESEKFLARRIVIDGQLAKIKMQVSELEKLGINAANYDELRIVIARLQEIINHLDQKLKL